MSYLFIALGALALGPAMLGRLRKLPALAAGLDGFVVVSIAGLIFLHFVPHAMEERNVALLGALLVGFLLPLVFEHVSRVGQGRADHWGLLLGITGLAIHAALDGAALATVSDTDISLALAIILHRIPVGIAVWWLASRVAGPAPGVVALASLMVATVLGFNAGTAVAELLESSELLELYQAVVGGSLVHVVIHRGEATAKDGKPQAEGSGGLIALALLLIVAVLPEAHGEHEAPFLDQLFVLAAVSAPALLLAYLFAGLLSAFVPSASIRALGSGGKLAQAGRGMLVGLRFPICSCGVVPLYRKLVAKGSPPAAAMAFLVATPELGLDALLLSIPLLGLDVTVLRLVTAGVAALLVGWWVGGRLEATPASSDEHPAEAAATYGERFRKAMITGTGAVVDHTAPWILLGLCATALLAPWLDGGWLASIPSPVAIVLFAALGFPMYVCAASATPLVAVLLAAGLSPGAGIAFLITGPATNVSTLGVLSSLHGRRAALAFTGALVAFAVLSGLAIDAAFPSLPILTLAQLTEEDPSPAQLFCLAGLVALFGASIARRGVRRFTAEIRDGLGWERHHDHAPA